MERWHVGAFARLNVGRLEGWKFGGDVAGAVVAKVGETGVGGEGLDHEGAANALRAQGLGSAGCGDCLVSRKSHLSLHSKTQLFWNNSVFSACTGPEIKGKRGEKMGYRELFRFVI